MKVVLTFYLTSVKARIKGPIEIQVHPDKTYRHVVPFRVGPIRGFLSQGNHLFFTCSITACTRLLPRLRLTLTHVGGRISSFPLWMLGAHACL